VPLRREVALSERDDDELMLLARGGVAAAFDTLIRRHQTAAIETARRELGSIDLAKDAAQNAFVQLYRYLPRYEARGKFKAFLYKVLLNHCRMARRSAGRASKLELVLELEVAESEALPDDAILRRERWREVERGLSRLSPKLRTVITLRFAGGLSYEEIAEVVGVNLGTVKSRLFNGIKKLREDLNP
jgi:RNA polymerase sigma-70 factor, ECF subfamily